MPWAGQICTEYLWVAEHTLFFLPKRTPHQDPGANQQQIKEEEKILQLAAHKIESFRI